MPDSIPAGVSGRLASAPATPTTGAAAEVLYAVSPRLVPMSASKDWPSTPATTSTANVMSDGRPRSSSIRDSSQPKRSSQATSTAPRFAVAQSADRPPIGTTDRTSQSVSIRASTAPSLTTRPLFVANQSVADSEPAMAYIVRPASVSLSSGVNPAESQRYAPRPAVPIHIVSVLSTCRQTMSRRLSPAPTKSTFRSASPSSRKSPAPKVPT